MFAIEVEKVSKDYAGRLVLHEVSFQVSQGVIHGFLGPNGAGKSTTLHLLTGLLNPNQGQIKILGHTVNAEEIKGKIGFLSEQVPLYQDMTVKNYLSFMAKLNRVTAEKVKEQVLAVMNLVGILEVQNRLIGKLSKGYRQRVGIAQSLVHLPPLVILDEPLVGLDPQSIQEIRQLILSLKGKHTVLFSSHQLHEIELTCDEVTILNQGKVLYSGNRDPLMQIPGRGLKIEAWVKGWKNEMKNTLEKDISIRFMEINHENEETKLVFEHPDLNVDLTLISSELLAKGLRLKSFHTQKIELEEIFLKLTGKK